MIGQYNSIETFTGGGGFLTGTKQAGFNTLIANDMWAPAIQTINLNYPEIVTIQREIQFVTPEELLETAGLEEGQLHHFHGSWPCQGNSSANVRSAQTEDPSIAEGFNWFIDKVEALQPEIATGENVAGILFSWKKGYFDEVIKRIQALGNYDCIFSVIPCAYYGANNWRPRLFLLLKRTDIAPGVKLSFPPIDEGELELRRLRSVFPYLDGYIDLQFGGKVKSNDHILSTMMANESLRVLENGRIRQLTIDEMKKVMTFPKDYLFPEVGRSTIWKLLGNAVPVETARRIMMHLRTTILDVHHGVVTPTVQKFAA